MKKLWGLAFRSISYNAMKRIIAMVAVATMTVLSVQAQNFPVGIASVQDSVKSAQVGLLSSVAISQMKGFQFGGFANMSAAPINGMQLSGVSNIAMGVTKGFQLSPLFNISAGEMRGLQTSFYNFSDSLSGVQTGFFNRSVSQRDGVQVGIINISRDTVARQWGLFNITPNTTIDLMIFGGNANKTNLALRLRNRHHYSIIGFGTHYMGLDSKFSGAIFYRLGLYHELSPRWTLSGDIGFAHVETFEENSADKPERLFSIQGRVNLEYQFSKMVGAFATVGYGDTRYYNDGSRYRQRPIFEAGMNMRFQHKMRQPPVKNNYESSTDDNELCMWPYKKKTWLAIAEMTGINVGVQLFDRWVLKSEFAQTTWNDIEHNLKNGFVWDNDFFITNLFAHPYHGNLYYNSARSNGLTFWESAPFALAGSTMWELFGETEPPAINDIFATTMGGIAIGEVTHRLSNAVLDDSYYGWSRFWREAAGFLINPIKGFNRIISGEAWRVRSSQNQHHDWQRFPIEFSVTAGYRYLADDGALFRGEHNPFVNLRLEYGDVLNEEENNKPYDYFDVEANFGLTGNQPFINRLHLLGRIWSTPMYSHKGMQAEFGIYQHFNYYDSEPIKNGSGLTPYRISEAAAFGPGFVVHMPQVGALNKLEQRIFLSGILLGGTKSDYFNVIERDYNMGSGFSVKSKTHLELKNFGRFITNVNYFRLFTWKGYEGKDLTGYANGTEDLHYLNVQGDKGNAHLLVINPSVEIDLGKNWGLNLNASYFWRKTNYKYRYDYDAKAFLREDHSVKAKTFEIKAGISYHL